MEISRKIIRNLILEAIVGAVGWTIALTPYMFLIVKVSSQQYLYWVIMEFVIVPPVAPFIFRLTKWIVNKFDH